MRLTDARLGRYGEDEPRERNGALPRYAGRHGSGRIVGETHSSLIDLPLIQVQDGRMVSVAAWYDNELVYSTRLAETARTLLDGPNA